MIPASMGRRRRVADGTHHVRCEFRPLAHLALFPADTAWLPLAVIAHSLLRATPLISREPEQTPVPVLASPAGLDTRADSSVTTTAPRSSRWPSKNPPLVHPAQPAASCPVSDLRQAEQMASLDSAAP
jgi:hypothetical protein